MAPEVMYNCGLDTYIAKADCWSLGVILYQLLSGYLPYPNGPQMTEKRWEKISDEGKELVKKLIEEDPVKRLNAVQAWEHVWLQGDNEVRKEARSIMLITEKLENQTDINKENGKVRRSLRLSGI